MAIIYILNAFLIALAAIGVNAADSKITEVWGAAQGCKAPELKPPQPAGVPVPPLPSGEKPNFIVILTDDQGWDDVGLHYPQKPGAPAFVNTPHLDAFMRAGTQFDNFYVTPLCAQTRAALLTGRDNPRTGTLLISGGYDFMSRDEVNMAEFFAAAGYKTAHFGKWHNGRSLGYEPWLVGFQESWLPEQYIHLDNLMQHNGEYVQTSGLMEQVLMDKVLAYLGNAAASNASQPFLLYYAPNAIHRGFMRPGVGPQWTRPSPEPYKARYRALGQQYRIPGSTLEVWAMLEYLDDVMGRLFDFVESSALRRNTYVLVMSDNGSELFLGELSAKQVRMPSGMIGYKRDVNEGGTRNFLAVRGPGVPAGAVDSTLLHITDVLPTLAALAGISPTATPHLPWDGVSFANLLSSNAGSGARGDAAASATQAGRTVFTLGPRCWDADAVPDLGADRRVLRPQPLLSYDAGGTPNRDLTQYYNLSSGGKSGVQPLGFQPCISARQGQYKWIGATGKVYRLSGGSHIELPCNEVSGEEGARVSTAMAAAAREWFSSLAAGPHAFAKPTFWLGLGGWRVTNLLPDGAHARTPQRVVLLSNGATGFNKPGDFLCFDVQVVQSGTYEVVAMYTSKRQGTFRFSVGPYSDILRGKAPGLSATLPVQTSLSGRTLGNLRLSASAPGTKVDACFTLTSSQDAGRPVFGYLGVLRLTLLDGQAGGGSGVGVAAVPRGGSGGAGTSTGARAGTQPGRPHGTRTQRSGTAPWQTSQGGGMPTASRQHQRPMHARSNSSRPAAAVTTRRNSRIVRRGGAGSTTVGAAAIAPPARGIDLTGEYAWLTRPVLEKGSSTGVAVASQAAMPNLLGTSLNMTAALPHLRPTPAMQRVERDARAAAAAAAARERTMAHAAPRSGVAPPAGSTTAAAAAAAAVRAFRLAHMLPEGQGRMESLFSPYAVEAVELCGTECQPGLD